MDDIANNSDKYQSIQININQYDSLREFKIGEMCGYIPDYLAKITNMNLDEFTTTRIKGLISIYSDMNSYLQNVTSKV